MFRNYFKTALRNLQRNKNSSFINISGLAVGIAVCLIIFLIIQFETSFDEFHKNKERIYRVITQLNDPDVVNYSAGVPFPLPRALKNDFPQLKNVAAIYGDDNTQIQVLDEKGTTDKKFKEETGVFFTQPDFFKIFDFKWLDGDPATALSEPNSAVLTKKIAVKYFGDWKNAIGKTIKRNNNRILKVTGILEDVPENTDFQFKVVISYNTLNISTSDDWVTVNSNNMCYLLLPPNISPQDINKQMIAFVKKYMPADRTGTAHLLQPLSEVHYDSTTGNYLRRTVSVQLINTLKLIAAFILLIACVNFINLATAQSINRSKEVGVRKVLGSNRRQIALQFLLEAALITAGAFVTGVLIAFAALPYIKNLLDLPLSVRPDIYMFVFLSLAGVAVVVLSGLYPAIILSGFNPVNSLKGKLEAKSGKGVNLRKALVVMQFVIAQALIIGTLIVVKQMSYFKNASLGFQKEAIITVPIPPDSTGLSKIDFVKERLLRQKEIDRVSFSFESPIGNTNWYSDFVFDNSPKRTHFDANLKWADADYLKTYNLKLIAGRNYFKSDTANEVVVNELLVKQLGLNNPQDVINKQLNFWDGRIKPVVVGVIKGFHSLSLQQQLAPVVIGNYKDVYGLANIKVHAKNIQPVINVLHQLWSSTYPEFVFEYKFLDETIANSYRQEKQLSGLYKIFAALAIFLSCLGLYGLASFMAVQKVKEVGIRKVLGASVHNIVYLFSKEFILLITIAFFIAAPIAWYFMNKWLLDFAYRIELPWWIFLVAGCLALVIALITVSFQAIKAAIANPVKSLRTE